MHRLSLFVAAVSGVFVLGATSPARAQPMDGEIGGDQPDLGESGECGTVEMELKLPNDDGTDFVSRSDQDIREFFNRANCLCGTEFTVETQIPSGDPTFDEQGAFYVGNSCASAMDAQARNEQCESVVALNDVVEELRQPFKPGLSFQTVIEANGDDTCESQPTSDRGVWLLVDDGNDNDNVWLCSPGKSIPFDLRPPPAPRNVTVSGGESSLIVEWELPASEANDIDQFQVLCARADAEVVDEDNFGGDLEFATTQTACNAPDSGLVPADVPADTPPQLLSLDPDTACGTASGTATSARIEGLENGVEYQVFLVAIDQADNPTVVNAGRAEPQPVRDFWEHYKEEGGTAEGGVCLINATYGDDHPFTTAMRDFRDESLASSAFGRWLTGSYYDYVAPLGAVVAGSSLLRPVAQLLLLPVIAVAYLYHLIGPFGALALLGLALWRRRQRHAAPSPVGRAIAVAGAAAVLLAVLAGPAAAQASYDPYWERWEDDEIATGPAIPHWNMELKVGPYLPSIDDEFTMEPGPFEQTFRGKDLWLFGLELQRFFLFPAGQLGATASIGFMGRSTNSFATDDMGNLIIGADGVPERASGNKTRFRMVPMSLGGVYRFTALDEQAGIPLVPYGKLGLSYYLWWIREPNGGFARTRKDPDCDPAATNCETTRGLGASLGWQASVGLALRAERLDPDAAVNLRNELGVEHAGFFFEMLYANVDHFGASDRLSVGDFTWLAGMSFEF